MDCGATTPFAVTRSRLHPRFFIGRRSEEGLPFAFASARFKMKDA